MYVMVLGKHKFYQEIIIVNQPGIHLDRSNQPPPPKPETIDVYAGFWFRAMAAIIDSILSYIISVALAIAIIYLLFSTGIVSMSTQAQATEFGEGVGFIISLIIQTLWWACFESSKWQATPGKKLFGLMVIDTEGRRITFGKALLRYLCKFLSFITILIGFIMAAFTKKKQALHDKMVGTLVIRVVKSKRVNHQ
jgi:uncharacterized RDD family membrane protein YckC